MRRNVVIYGCPLLAAESADPGSGVQDIVIRLFKEIGVVVAKDMISAVYRMGKGSNGKVAPIFVEFKSVETRRLVMKNKANLARCAEALKKVRIDDDLTKARSHIMKKLMTDQRIAWVSSIGGRLVIHEGDGVNNAPGVKKMRPKSNGIMIGRLEELFKIRCIPGEEIVSMLDVALELQQ